MRMVSGKVWRVLSPFVLVEQYCWLCQVFRGAKYLCFLCCMSVNVLSYPGQLKVDGLNWGNWTCSCNFEDATPPIQKDSSVLMSTGDSRAFCLPSDIGLVINSLFLI